MIDPFVEFVLDTLDSVVAAQPPEHDLRRVDRDNSVIYQGSDHISMETPIARRSGELKQSNFVGATLTDRANDPIGTSYDYNVDAVVGVRIEGYSGSFGHVAKHPDDSGVSFLGTGGLVHEIRDALNSERCRPDAGRVSERVRYLLLTNESNLSADWADYHRYDFDVLFELYEELP